MKRDISKIIFFSFVTIISVSLFFLSKKVKKIKNIFSFIKRKIKVKNNSFNFIKNKNDKIEKELGI